MLHSEETKLKMSLAHKGKIKAPEHLANISKALTGKKFSKERSERLCISRKGKKLSEQHRINSAKGHVGLHWEMSEEAKKNVSAAQKKRFETKTAWNKGKEYHAIKGENNPNWKGGVSPQDKLLRKKFRDTVLKEVFARDNYTCQHCYKKGGYLHADHIQKWADNPEKRFDIDNCIALCMACHYKKTFNKTIPIGIKWGYNNNHLVKYN